MQVGMKKSPFLTSISLHRVLWLSSEFVDGQEMDDEMFMTRSLNVMPKTTEQHLIIIIIKWILLKCH